MRKSTIVLGMCLLFLANAASATTNPTNLVVDFDNTAVSSSLHPGDSGILNLVVSNTGSYRADGVDVHLVSSFTLDTEKNFYIGTVAAGQSKSISVPIRVDSKAKTGLKTIRVVIFYDGYDSAGARDSNKESSWAIPVIIYGDPLFQLDLAQTTYFKDTLSDLTITGFTKDAVKDLTATLSSSCVTVIGSSRKYVGSLPANQGFNVTFTVKPNATGACQTSFLLSYKDASGASATDNITMGLNVEGAGVDFKIINVSYGPTGPGETVSLKINLKNVGKAEAQDTTLSLSLSSPFVPVDTTEKYVGGVGAGGSIEVVFNVNVGMDASIEPYSIPLNISYKVGGSSYSVGKDIGLDVTGKIILEIINVDTSRGLQIEVANIGTRAAEGVKAILTMEASGNQTMQRPQLPSTDSGERTPSMQRPTANPLTMLAGGRAGGRTRPTEQTHPGGVPAMGGSSGGQLMEYKSDIKPTKQTTFTFDTTLTGPAILTLEYTGLNNERITQVERINAGSARASMTSFTRNGGEQSNTGKYLLYLLAALVVWVLYAKKTKRKVIPGFVSRKLKRSGKSE